MTAVHEAVVDSVKKLGLNGSSEHTNGVIKDDFKVRTICCVGAGYVGTSFYLCFVSPCTPTIRYSSGEHICISEGGRSAILQFDLVRT